ncbi:MAG: transcription antitermination factor NusB [Deltaproteobacteria bacterium]|nr:transcription antitermination factor NusB [Deltaproteobacteria bacterium]
MKRRKAREAALQALYQLDIAGGGDEAAGGAVPAVRGHDRAFTSLLVDGTREHLFEIDAMIERFAEHWSIGRMAVVDRNILRLAIFELRYYENTPYRVVIDEAVELAKKFGSEESGAFINGILDSVGKMIPSSTPLTAR